MSKDLLLRVLLVRCVVDEFALQIVFHHAVTDLWSLNIFNQEVSSIYRDLAVGQAIVLPELPIQYVDYALWQRSQLSGERLEQQLGYWTEQLKSPRSILNLPLDFPRPAIPSHEGARVEFTVGSELRGKLAGLCLENHATMFMLLMSAFDVLIYRYSGQTDILLGVPIANRVRVEFENLIGFFVNTLVLRADLSGAPRFSEVLQRVRRLSLDAFANQDMPFEKLVQVLNPARMSSHTPLFQAGFTYHNTPSSSFELVGVDIDSIPLERGISRFDLTLFISDQGDKLSGSLEFSTELFTPRRAGRMVWHFTNLLRQICEAPDTPIDRLRFLSEEEIRETLTGWNENRRFFAPDICLHQLFEAQVRSAPDRTALIYPQVQGGERQSSVPAGAETLSYHELNLRANQAARRLRELGVERNSLVGLCMKRSLDLLVGLLGILKAGGAYVPIEPDVPCERLDLILRDCSLKVVAAQSATARLFADFPVQVVCMDGEAGSLAQLESGDLSIGVSPEDPAYVIYTSGSTGTPKGVVVSHYNVVRLIQSTQEIFDFDDNDVWTLFHSHAFDFSVWEIWGALLHGGKLVVVPYWTSRDPAAFSRLIAAHGVTILNQTPSAFYPLLQIPEFRDPGMTPSLRWVIFGGEALSLPMLKPWFAHRPGCGTRLVNMYGITETTVHVTFRPIEPADCEHSRSVIGKPLPDLRLYLLDEALEPVPFGIPGEIFVSGAGLAVGYLGRPGLSAERFIPDPFGEDPGSRLYRSGDLARRVEGGDLEYLGRRDSQVKIRGFRIELGEIEAALSDFPGVRQVAVSLWKPEQDDDSRAGERLVAHIALAGEPDTVEMRRFLTTRLPEYMIPATFVILPSLPLTANGKIDRKALPAPEPHQGKGGGGFAAHGSVLENLLTRLWTEILQVDFVGPQDDFFELGGHSLLAVNLTNRLNSVFYLDLDARMVFEEPTPEGYARRLRRDAADPDRLDQIASLILEVTDLPGDQDASSTGT